MVDEHGGWTLTFPQLLLLLFIGLKLTNVIQWSWWWVLAPAWFPLALAFVFLITYAMLRMLGR